MHEAAQAEQTLKRFKPKHPNRHGIRDILAVKRKASRRRHDEDPLALLSVERCMKMVTACLDGHWAQDLSAHFASFIFCYSRGHEADAKVIVLCLRISPRILQASSLRAGLERQSPQGSSTKAARVSTPKPSEFNRQCGPANAAYELERQGVKKGEKKQQPGPGKMLQAGITL